MKAIINGTSIAFDDVGAGPAVVLIHDFPLSRRMWHPQISALTEAGYRVIAPDLRGFGESQVPEGSWSLATLATDLVQLLNYLGIGRAFFCGTSMGGSVLFHLLDRYPNKVVGACFVSSRSRADDLMEKSHRTKTIEKIMKGQRGEVTSLICSQLLSEEAVSKKNELLPALKEWIEATDTRSLISGLQAMRDRKDFTAKTREILHPTLVITGEADRMVPPEHGRGLALSLGAGYELPGAGHMVNLEQPENFNNCLIEFLASIRQCRPKKPSLQKVA